MTDTPSQGDRTERYWIVFPIAFCLAAIVLFGMVGYSVYDDWSFERSARRATGTIDRVVPQRQLGGPQQRSPSLQTVITFVDHRGNKRRIVVDYDAGRAFPKGRVPVLYNRSRAMVRPSWTKYATNAVIGAVLLVIGVLLLRVFSRKKEPDPMQEVLLR